MSNKKGSRGIPVDMGHGLTPLPTSSKGRKQEAEAAAAAAVIAEKQAEAARKVESDRLYKKYMAMHQPPKPSKSVTCALCKEVKSVDDAIALGWKKHPFRFENQAVCDACDAVTVPFMPFTASPKLVWAKPDHLSTRHKKLIEALDHTKKPSNALKAQAVAYSEFEPDVQKKRPNIMRPSLSAAFLTPPVAGIYPFTQAQLTQLTKSINSRRKQGGTKSKTKSKRSKTKRSRAHR